MKIAGVEVKPWMAYTAGGAVLLVVILMLRRGGAEAVPVPVQEPTMMAGGGGGGASTPTSPIGELADAYTSQLNDLALEEKRESLRQRTAMFELQKEQAGILANLFVDTERDRAATERSRYALEREVYAGQEASARRINAAAGDFPIKCPPDHHPVNMPGVGVTCRPLGNSDGSRGFNPLRQVGQVLGGFLTGVAAAAPGIGAGAANYAAANTGLIPGQAGGRSAPQRQVGEWEYIGVRSGEWTTPGINPSAPVRR